MGNGYMTAFMALKGIPWVILARALSSAYWYSVGCSWGGLLKDVPDFQRASFS